MDDSRFDALARSLTTAGSRRRALGGLLAGTLGVLGRHDGDESAAHDLKAKCKKKSGGAKKKCLKKAKKHAAEHAAATSLGPLPPGPTCTDGSKNGSESDVDCGGSCPRCPTGQGCATRNDCDSAFCSGGTCVACTQSTDCPKDATSECNCFAASGTPGICLKKSGTIASSCAACPADTARCAVNPFNPPGGVLCSKRCGAT